MSNHCLDCKTLVSLVLHGEPATSLEVEGDTVTLNARLVLICGDCGYEVSESYVEVSEDVSHFQHADDAVLGGCEGILDLSGEPDIRTDDYYDGSGRYAKHFYRAIVDVTILCEECGHEMHLSLQAIAQANQFEGV